MPKITELFAVIDDTDGIVGFMTDGVWHPMVFNTLSPLKLKMAQEIANKSRKTLTVAQFSNRQDIQTIKPK